MRISGLLMSYLWGEKHLKSFTIQMISSAKASFLQNNLEFSIDSNLVMMPIYRSLPVFQDGGRTRSTHRRYSTILWKNFQPVSALIEVKNFISKGSKISAKIVLKNGSIEPPCWNDICRRQFVSRVLLIEIEPAQVRYQNPCCYFVLALWNYCIL